MDEKFPKSKEAGSIEPASLLLSGKKIVINHHTLIKIFFLYM